MPYDLAVGYLLDANPTLLLGSIQLSSLECLVIIESDFPFQS